MYPVDSTHACCKLLYDAVFVGVVAPIQTEYPGRMDFYPVCFTQVFAPADLETRRVAVKSEVSTVKNEQQLQTRHV